MVVLPFLAMCFVVLKGFVYTVGVDVYAFYLAFCGKSHHIQQHFTLHLAPKRTPFSTKTHSIQHQNALHLAAKRTPFSGKTHCIQQQIARKWVQMASFSNKYSFCQHSHVTPFCIKTNLRENRLFAARCAIGGQNGQL